MFIIIIIIIINKPNDNIGLPSKCKSKNSASL